MKKTEKQKTKIISFCINLLVVVVIFLISILNTFSLNTKSITNRNSTNLSFENELNKEIWVNNDEYFVENDYYSNNDYLLNVHLLNNGDNRIMNYNKISGTQEEKFNKGVRWFDDNNEIGDGNETEYSPIANIYFSKNIDYVENISIYFEIKDIYREVNSTGWFSSKTEDGANKIHMLNESKTSETIGDTELSTGDATYYEDYVYYDKYGDDTRLKEFFPFRFTYTNNDLGESDIITIYEKNPSQLNDDNDTSEGWGHGFIGEGYVGGEGNNDVFIKNSLKIKCDIHYDEPEITKIDFNRTLFSLGLFDSAENTANKTYFKYDENTNEYVVSENEFDKITYDFYGANYETILNNFVIDELFENTIQNFSKFSNLFINKYVRYEIDDSNLTRDLFDSDIKIKYGSNSENYVVLDENWKEDLKGKNTTFNNSQAEFYVTLNENSPLYYDDENSIFDVDSNGKNDDYGFYKNNSNLKSSVMVNLPFYNWTFEEISLEKKHKTFYNEDTSFLIPEVKLKEEIFKESYDIDVYTNSNIRFSVEDDSNISSVKFKGNNVNPYKDNSYMIETNFDELSESSTESQKQTVTIYYKNKVTNPNFEDPVNQSVNINFIYDSDSPINNKTTSVIEDVGANSKEISSQVLSIAENSESFLEDNVEDNHLINFYKVNKDVQFKFTKEEFDSILNLDISFDSDEYTEVEDLYLENLYRYTPQEVDGKYQLVKEEYNYVNYSSQLNISEAGLYNWIVRTKSGMEYSYWILISKSFTDFDEDDGISSNNYLPIEWEILKESGYIDYDSENKYYSIGYENKIYIKEFVETLEGELLIEKAKKKGWTKSELEKEPSYSIEKLILTWDKLIDFKYLIIDVDSVANTTIELEEKNKNRFKDVEILLENEIIKQLTNDENKLSYYDFEINFYGENEEEISQNKIIKNDYEIFVVINSTKYGQGMNELKFSFYPKMIEPTPLWIKTSVVLIILFAILFIAIIAMSIIERKRNIKIKG